MLYLLLSNGVKMPQLGYGCAAIKTFGDTSDFVTQAIRTAIEVGYRHLDTASVYKTEGNVARAIAESGIPRSEFFITTKLHTDDMNYDDALRAAEKSLKELNTDYIDLYLIHWPLKDKYLDAWKALEKLYEEKQVKAIGGSNFAIRHFEGIATHANIKPMTNQVELNPYMQQKELRAYCQKENIALTAWSPLGTGNWTEAKEEDKPLTNSLIKDIARKYRRLPPQVILRWILDIGVAVIPKSEKPNRIVKNFDVFNFTLSEEDINAIAEIDKEFSISAAFNESNRVAYESI